jgi:hypothetical protein
MKSQAGGFASAGSCRQHEGGTTVYLRNRTGRGAPPFSPGMRLAGALRIYRAGLSLHH